MQQPKMIVLALMATGLRYGFEMEEFARRTSMRQWAKIGMSSIYKALADLEREGSITVEVEESDKGPARKAFRLTDSGRGQMTALIGEALASNASIYSERIAGLVFAPLIGPQQARAAICSSVTALEDADVLLEQSQEDEGMDEIGLAVIEFYRTVYAAERKAMQRVLKVADRRTG
jgi:DNA-binding PadR family transcriptional regulator